MTKASQRDPKGAEIADPKKPRHEEDREKEEKENGLDHTIADSFPASDPPSSIPDPEDEENVA
jgi:hypothetical protein